MSLSGIFDPLVRAWFEENGTGGGKAVDDGYYITWDRNIAGRPFIDLSFMIDDAMTSAGLYKVSDAIISAEGFDGFAGAIRLGADGVVNSDQTTIAAASGWTAVFLGDVPIVVSGKAGKYNYNGIPIVIPADGTYFLYMVQADGDTVHIDNIYNSIGGSTGGGTGGGEDDAWIGDGNTHIWVSLPEGRTSPMLGVRPNGTVTVDWGDGTEPDVLTGTSVWTVKWTPVHNYAKAGDYRITLTVEGEAYLAGMSTTHAYTYILRHSSDVDQRNVAYHAAVQKVEVGNNVFVYANAFFNCYNMRQIKLLNDSIVESELTFANCYVLESVKLSDNSVHIGSSAFSNCYRMYNIEIPGSITTIRANAFARCYTMKKYDFTSCTAVPTLVNTNAFDNISPDCEILVPAALVDSWKAATNWATYADYIVGV